MEPTENDILIWILDDDPLYRRALESQIMEMPGICCAGTFESCEAALRALEATPPPDVVMVDIGFPGMSGLEGIRRIKSMAPSTHCVVLTVHEEDEHVFEAVCAGASGYLVKSPRSEEVGAAILEVVHGGAPINPHIAQKLLRMFSRVLSPTAEYSLTEREKEILRQFSGGLVLKEVADRLHLSTHTVDSHLRNIYAKLHVHTRSGAVAKAMKDHMI
jgi:DNA-binding NarL/FixJ family response regulator